MHDRDEQEQLLNDHDIELTEAENATTSGAASNHGRAVQNRANTASSANASAKEVIPWSALPNKRQLFILGLCRLSEPLSNTCLLPYIFYLMRSIVAPGNNDLNDDQHKQISLLSGVLVAIFPLMQLMTSMLYARWADKYGRRLIIVAALFVSAISNLGFGFSRSFWRLMFWRALAGLANGNVGVLRTVTAEIVKERKYQTKAFLLLPLIFNSGMVLGLAVGGVLADPVHNVPWLFGPDGILNLSNNAEGVGAAVAFPFALPAIFNFSCLAVSLLLATCGLRETLDGCEAKTDIGLRIGQFVKALLKSRVPRRLSGYVAVAAGDDIGETNVSSSMRPSRTVITEKSVDRLSTTEQIWTRDVLCALISFGLLPMHNGAFMHIYPVFLSGLPSKENSSNSQFHFKGGMGMHSRSIGMYLAFFGLCGIMLQLYIYPRLQARLGTLGTFRIALYIFPVVYLLAPFMVMLPKSGIIRWLCIALVTCGQVMARTLAIPSTVILVTHAAPAKSVLGRIHGAGNMAASFARAAGPALGGWVFAKGIEHDMVGMVWWFYLFVVALMALAWSFTMRRLNDAQRHFI